MKRLLLILSVVGLVAATFSNTAQAKRYGLKYCDKPGFKCVKVKRGHSWEKMFPDVRTRDMVKRLNRMNTGIWSGMIIAVPDNPAKTTVWDVSPFPLKIDSGGEKVIVISQKELAWGAYDAKGHLVWWGPISPGKNFCGDTGKGCKTPGGNFRIIRRQGPSCISSKFPLETNGGAPMPYCMHFFGGYALHGSYSVPGYRASHGCVRMFNEDARWLNNDFIVTPGKDRKGTRVIVHTL